jgi:ketosteroid isomerase-like protein
VEEGLASRFRTAYEGSAEAFNEGDLAIALGTLPEDLEWQAPPQDPDHDVCHGPAELQVWFEDLRGVFDEWRVEVRDVEALSDRTLVVHHVITGTSRGAGVPVEVVTFEVWEFGPLDDGSHPAWRFVGLRPTRVRQFFSREEAVAAAQG